MKLDDSIQKFYLKHLSNNSIAVYNHVDLNIDQVRCNLENCNNFSIKQAASVNDLYVINSLISQDGQEHVVVMRKRAYLEYFSVITA